LTHFDPLHFNLTMGQNRCLCNLGVVLLLLHAPALDAFTPLVTPRGVFAKPQALSTTFLCAKKRRRKRESIEPDAADGSSSTDSPPAKIGSDLPDFNLKEEAEEAAPRRRVSTNSDEITPAMMASSNKPARSLKELIADRSLETKFEFEDNMGEDEALPDLIELIKGGSSNKQIVVDVEGEGKKKARQADRKAAAVAREKEEAGPFDFLNGIEALVDKDKGEVTFLKIVEAGTWLAIYALVGWELYINTPFFDRSAPLAPVVF
jgi:hypothetical protein